MKRDVSMSLGLLLAFALGVFVGFVMHAREEIVAEKWLASAAYSDYHFTSLQLERRPERQYPLVSILAFGDIMLDRNVRRAMDEHGEDYPFESIFGTDQDKLPSVDIITGNLEGAISKRRAPHNLYDFAFASTTGEQLKRYGFIAVSLANNHGHDQGVQGYEDTISALKKAGVGYFGAPFNDNAEVWTKEANGTKVSMLGFNQTKGVVNEGVVRKLVESAATDSDIALVQVHWGDEYKHYPNEAQLKLGRQLVDWGADAVIGHHPHVIQGMEVYKDAPIFWSLGNFIFDQDFRMETQQGLAAHITFYDGRTESEIIPIQSINHQPHLATSTKEQILKDFGVYSTHSENFAREHE